MITAIKPTARESYDRNWKLEKDEENLFVERLNNADRRKQRRWDDVRDSQQQQVANAPFSFDNPAFNIITGSTNYLVLELSAEIEKAEPPAIQLDLFHDKFMRRV